MRAGRGYRQKTIKQGELAALPLPFIFGTINFMADQELKVPKKRGRPNGRNLGTTFPVRVSFELECAFETWINAQPDPKPSRAKAIRIALTDWLISQGLLPIDTKESLK